MAKKEQDAAAAAAPDAAKPTKRKKTFKKRGEKRVVHHGFAHIQASFNNTVITITDAEGRGGDAKGLARRLGSAARGVGHGALAVAAFGLATGSGDGGGEDKRELASRALDVAGGSWLLWLGAAAVLAYACYQLYRAYAAKLGSQLDVGAASVGLGRWVIGLSRAGIAARGVVFGLIGVLLVRAAQHGNPQEAGGIRDSLQMLGAMGRWPLAVVALGLVAYAVYELLNARYRRIRVA